MTLSVTVAHCFCLFWSSGLVFLHGQLYNERQCWVTWYCLCDWGRPAARLTVTVFFSFFHPVLPLEPNYKVFIPGFVQRHLWLQIQVPGLFLSKKSSAVVGLLTGSFAVIVVPRAHSRWLITVKWCNRTWTNCICLLSVVHAFLDLLPASATTKFVNWRTQMTRTGQTRPGTEQCSLLLRYFPSTRTVQADRVLLLQLGNISLPECHAAESRNNFAPGRTPWTNVSVGTSEAEVFVTEKFFCQCKGSSGRKS